MLKARDCVHWLVSQRDIIEMIQRCIHCAEHNMSQQKTPTTLNLMSCQDDLPEDRCGPI